MRTQDSDIALDKRSRRCYNVARSGCSYFANLPDYAACVSAAIHCNATALKPARSRQFASIGLTVCWFREGDPQMLRHSVFRIVAVLLAMLMLLAACGGGGTTTPAAGGATAAPAAPAADATAAPAAPAADATAAPAASGDQQTVTWGFWGSPEEKASHEKVAAEFMKTHPNIKIEIWHQPWDDYFTKLKTLWASGDSKQIPDVLFLWPTPSYAATGVLEDLDPYIQKSGYDI